MVKEKIKEKYFEGVGKRKTALGRVRLTPSARSLIVVNGKDVSAYFKTEELRQVSTRTLTERTIEGKLHVSAVLKGGGAHSQAEAMNYALAKALSIYKPELRKELKKGKLLTRDARIKERRKFGLKKARKAPQWSKR